MTIIITVKNGVADVKEKPAGVEVIIQDFDMGELDEGYTYDENLDPMVEEIWGKKDVISNYQYFIARKFKEDF